MSGWFRQWFHEVGRFDRGVNAAVARLPVTGVDRGVQRLTRTADYGVLWLVVAALLAGRRGADRRAAVRATASIAGASLTAHLLKGVIGRRRPAAELLPLGRRLDDRPTSSSFPSGHSASAAAFLTAVALESPRSAKAVAPLAATVAYSRVHTGVHWPSDVIAGAVVGAGVAYASRRWWPVRESDEAHATVVREVPSMVDGKGLVALVNPLSGLPGYDPTDDVAEALPAATVLRGIPGLECAQQMEHALALRTERVEAVGVAGGDGTVAAIATVALRHGLPLVVIPTGTLNHFARDVGVYDLREVVDATDAGEAVAVDVACVEFDGAGPEGTRYLINTASLGAYIELVRLREKWQGRWGKWPAFAAALVVTLRRAEPIRIHLDGRWHEVWFLFVGNGPYHPHGAVPAYRRQLDAQLLDVRWLRADIRFSRTRAVLALLLGAIGRSKVYHERLVSELDVRLATPQALATDGEVDGQATRLHFKVAGRIPVYRRNENNPRWSDRARPHHRR
ncbi:bifunctional phosphatase PAP2/diacylglycerol kinase family protein [Nocardia transvalensis]|uniref:bifunctional phosphatase PAP2/diacylglycerol kinase family protein n=1 Tax=Nocardia transvalensis TaxID=37333 RepID=UPI001895E4FA|nr:phosphatase PAP2 family protein [Nocardia transvalensis]MBF6331665.1 phosphatase PAP2 family protein [Nocardia transvalensis]